MTIGSETNKAKYNLQIKINIWNIPSYDQFNDNIENGSTTHRT